MQEPLVGRLVANTLRGRLSRREVLETGLKLGVATPLLTTLVAQAPAAVAAPVRSPFARQDAGQDSSGVFTAVIVGGTEDLDPHSTYSTIGSLVALGCYEMLVRYKGDSLDEVEPMLADSWETSADGLSCTFKLSPTATFHDGTVCDAAAVKASMVRLVQMGLGPYLVVARFVPDPENQISVVDATTITFTFAKPEPLFLPAMASAYGPFVVSPKAVEENKTDDDPWAHEFFLFNAVGTGPYQLVSADLVDGYQFTKFDAYHRGWEGNHFDEVILRIVPEGATRRQLVETGEADAITNALTPEDLDAIEQSGVAQVVRYGTTRVNHVFMNMPRLRAPEARQGFSYAFPYDEVANGAFKGLLTRSGPLPTVMLGVDPDVFMYQTDLVKAKELILSAGFVEGDVFDYMYLSGDEVEKAVAQLFQANVQAMGFQLDLVEVELSTQEATIFGDAGAEEKPCFVGAWPWWPDYNDPWNMLAPLYLIEAAGGGGSNMGYYYNERFEQLMVEARDATDSATIVTAMKEIQSILTELDPPAIYYGETEMGTVLGNAIQGFVANPIYLEAYDFYRMSRV
jgi:peptide/nickel transport system substrate-binding protein